MSDYYAPCFNRINFVDIPSNKKIPWFLCNKSSVETQRGSRTAVTSTTKYFVIIINGWKPLTIITKRSILDVAVALNPLLKLVGWHLYNAVLY